MNSPTMDALQPKRALDGSSVVFYVDTTDSSTHDLYQCYKYIVQGAKNVIKACQEYRVKQLVYNSSSDVVFDGSHDIRNADESVHYPSKYQDMLLDFKAQAEALILRASDHDGLLTCALRPSNVFGPGDPYLVYQLVNQANSIWAKFILGNGDTWCDFTYVENAAHAHICAAEALDCQTAAVAGKAFFISNLVPRNYWDFVSRIYTGLGYERPRIKLPAWLVHFVLQLLRMIRDKLGSETDPLLESVHYAIQSALFTRTFSCSAAQTHLRYSPIVSTEEGIALTVKSFSHLARDSLPERYSDFDEESKVDKILGSGKVADILLWRDEKETFLYFLATALLLCWFFLSGRTFLSSAAALLLLTAFSLFVHNILPLHVVGFSFQRLSSSSFEMSDSGLRDILATIASCWNKAAHVGNSLARGEDWRIFLKAVAFLYFLRWALSFPLSKVLGAATIFSFVGFFICEQYEEEIGSFTSLAYLLAKNLKILLRASLPPSVLSFFTSDDALHQE